MSIRSERKEEHLALAQMFFDEKKKNSFDQMHLLRPALPEKKADLNTIKTEMFGKSVSAPFFINAMTGGSKKSRKVNRALGIVSEKQKIALALGSSSILVKEKDQLDSFYIAREENPHGVLIANVNPLTPFKDAIKIANELQADALQIHVNTVQEIAMPEGERDFHWLNNMREISDNLDLQLLKREHFDLVDIAGSGGTNFAQIENGRNHRDVSYLQDLGLPTVVTALMAKKANANFIVSGGVRNPLDVLKGLALEGKYVGIANVFLQEYMQNGEKALLERIQNWKIELANLLAIYGLDSLRDATKLQQYYDFPLKNIIDQLV